MNKRPPAKKPQAKIQTVKKQIPVKKIAPDRIGELVKKHLGNIGEAENAFKSVSAGEFLQLFALGFLFLPDSLQCVG